MSKCTAAAQQYGEQCSHHHTLPFTGLDLVMILIAGLVIIAVGFGVRHLGNSR